MDIKRIHYILPKVSKFFSNVYPHCSNNLACLFRYLSETENQASTRCSVSLAEQVESLPDSVESRAQQAQHAAHTYTLELQSYVILKRWLMHPYL